MRPSRWAGCLALTILALASVPAAGADDGAITIDALLARFKAVPGLAAKWHEEKRIALLAKPLVSDGTIHYAPPQKLARHTLTPSIASVVLDGTTLKFGDGTKEETIDLAQKPAVRALVDGFAKLLAGDRAGLEKSFSIEQTAAKGDHWELVLKPKTDDLARVVTEMGFVGDGVVLKRMRVLEASGDEATTTFTNVDANHAYGAEEQARVFRLPKK